MSMRENTIVQTLFLPSAQTAEWMAAARTPETRARIQRWSRIETAGIAATLMGITLLLLASFASIGVAVWHSVTDGDPAGPLWWIWGTAVGVAGIGALTWVLGSSRRQAACFADGYETVGTVDRAIEHPGSGDDLTWWDVRISAAVAESSVLRRRLHIEGEHHNRRVGGPVRFRHNTLRPDALDDVHLVDWAGTIGHSSRRGRNAVLPALDRTPRIAMVTVNEESDFMTGWPGLYVTYRGTDGRQHEVRLADHVDDSWLDRFPAGSTWQVYCFRDPALADTVVFLTEEHGDVWRSGTYLWLGVRGEVRTGQFRKPRPGSPFLGEDSPWRFEP
ncbi:hypothetical protein OG554_22715 [Streptomyces griseus]|uniref:hypothetical protein n=1 Tax=Streptomyces griseus TaxID=1911 RepID=UPI00386FE0DD|nr:hypothetical protein OG554_22715 [Streptomyces fimicarius]